MDKKGQTGGRKVFSLILGLIFIVLGGIPLLNYLKVISFTFPTIPLVILSIVALAGAIMLIIDGFNEEQGFTGASKTVGIISIIIALVLIIYGLDYFGILPFNIPAIGMIIINVIFAVAGILLIIGGFTGF